MDNTKVRQMEWYDPLTGVVVRYWTTTLGEARVHTIQLDDGQRRGYAYGDGSFPFMPTSGGYKAPEA